MSEVWLEWLYSHQGVVSKVWTIQFIITGRPDWSQVLPDIIEDMNINEGSKSSEMIRPKVYACGPAALCKDLRTHCSKLKITYKEEVFNWDFSYIIIW